MNPMHNFFDLTGVNAQSAELFEELLKGDKVRVERIVSKGQVTPAGEWYDQGWDEWVMVISGKAVLELQGSAPLKMEAGDYLLIPAHCRHRVNFTSRRPECIWLAIHGVFV